MADLEKRIGESVRHLRGDMSQTALAEKMVEAGFPKWSQATVWGVEQGKRALKFTEALALSEMFDVETDDLVRNGYQRALSRRSYDLMHSLLALGRAALAYERDRLHLKNLLASKHPDMVKAQEGQDVLFPHDHQLVQVTAARFLADALRFDIDDHGTLKNDPDNTNWIYDWLRGLKGKGQSEAPVDGE